METLTCCKCGQSTIPAPPGSTAGTKFTCSDCTRKITGSGYLPDDFWARPHPTVNPRIGRTEQSWWDRQGAELRAGTKVARTECHLRNPTLIARLLETGSTKMSQAKRRGELWTRAATAQNLAGLPGQQLRAMVLVFLEDHTHREAATFMDISESTLSNHIAKAKYTLLVRARKGRKKSSGLVTQEAAAAVI